MLPHINWMYSVFIKWMIILFPIVTLFPGNPDKGYYGDSTPLFLITLGLALVWARKDAV